MGNELSDVELSGENQSGDVVLEGDVRGIAANEVLFVDADFGKVDWGFGTAAGMSKNEDLAGAADLVEGLEHGRIDWSGDYGGIDGRL